MESVASTAAGALQGQPLTFNSSWEDECKVYYI